MLAESYARCNVPVSWVEFSLGPIGRYQRRAMKPMQDSLCLGAESFWRPGKSIADECQSAIEVTATVDQDCGCALPLSAISM